MWRRLEKLFGFGGGRSRSEKTNQLAMPLFARPGSCSPAKVVEAWASMFPRQPPIRETEGTTDPVNAPGSCTTAYEVDSASLVAAEMPLPIPTTEAVDAVRTSWMWQEPDDPVRNHRAHAVVTAMASGDAVRDAWHVARLSAAMLKAGEGVALYWGSSRQVHLPKVVEALAASDSLPVPLWVGITVSAPSSAGPFSAATHGMESLGHKEFELLDTGMGIGGIRSTLLDVAGYVLERGPVLLHGQTCGPDGGEKWTIRHARSRLVPGRDAIVLGIP
jgi:hypothetical protein